MNNTVPGLDGGRVQELKALPVEAWELRGEVMLSGARTGAAASRRLGRRGPPHQLVETLPASEDHTRQYKVMGRVRGVLELTMNA